MPKYHLVSDVLLELVIDDERAGLPFLLNIINTEWAAGKIKLLYFPPGAAGPEVLEPAPKRQLIINRTSGNRWITCAITDRTWRDPGFKDPVISDEDVRYLAERAAVTGLPLTETWRDVRSLQGEAPKPPENEAGDIHTAEQLPDPARPQPGKGGRKPGSGAIDDEAAIRRMLKILAQDEAPSVFAAARVVAERDGVEGVSFESTRRRLSRKFGRRHGTRPPSGKSWSDIVE